MVAQPDGPAAGGDGDGSAGESDGGPEDVPEDDDGDGNEDDDGAMDEAELEQAAEEAAAAAGWDGEVREEEGLAHVAGSVAGGYVECWENSGQASTYGFMLVMGLVLPCCGALLPLLDLDERRWRHDYRWRLHADGRLVKERRLAAVHCGPCRPWTRCNTQPLASGQRVDLGRRFRLRQAGRDLFMELPTRGGGLVRVPVRASQGNDAGALVRLWNMWRVRAVRPEGRVPRHSRLLAAQQLAAPDEEGPGAARPLPATPAGTGTT
jgi:hypothetical protein